MRISAAAFFMILTTIFLSACESGKMAAVDDKGTNYYSRHGVLSLNGAPSMSGPTVAAAPVESVQVATNTPPASPLKASGSWQWPVDGKVTETFGQKSDGVANEGIVIEAAEGTRIKAAQAGEVAFVGRDTKNYGNIVILRHASGEMTSYAHAKEIRVQKGDRVNAGQVIATVGQSGNAKSPQLHFALREGKTSVDPMTKLPHQVAMNQ